MISRRSIRIKVMQVLYGVAADSSRRSEEYDNSKRIKNQLEETRKLIVYNLYLIKKIAAYAPIYAAQKAAKNLPSAADLKISKRIAQNRLIQSLEQNEGLQKYLNLYKFNLPEEAEIIKKIFLDLLESDEYKFYTSLKNIEPQQEKDIVHYLFNKVMLHNDIFLEYIEDNFYNWIDDCEVIESLVNSFLDNITQSFDKIIPKEKLEFALALFETVIEKKEYLSSLIKPKLKNWDIDRIAMLDIIILQMGISELLYFDHIPTKVTINEYIDIAKEYSTEQSGQFVNGVLDGIHKEMVAEGRIIKTDEKF